VVAQRVSIRMLRPMVQPKSASPCTRIRSTLSAELGQREFDLPLHWFVDF
jgi:hypothetical protein